MTIKRCDTVILLSHNVGFITSACASLLIHSTKRPGRQPSHHLSVELSRVEFHSAINQNSNTIGSIVETVNEMQLWWFSNGVVMLLGFNFRYRRPVQSKASRNKNKTTEGNMEKDLPARMTSRGTTMSGRERN
jgi:hypothetical protein